MGREGIEVWVFGFMKTGRQQGAGVRMAEVVLLPISNQNHRPHHACRTCHGMASTIRCRQKPSSSLLHIIRHPCAGYRDKADIDVRRAR